MRSKGAVVKRFVRVLAAVLACLMVTAGAAGAVVGQKAKKQTVAKYAKTVCGSYTTLTDKVQGFIDDYGKQPSEDPAGIQDETVSLGNGLLDDIAVLEKKLKKAYPDVDGGKKISKSFSSNMGDLHSKIKEQVDKLAAADPNNAAFVGDIATFEAQFNVIAATSNVNDPFSKLKDQDLLKAFDKEKSCKDVVTVFGA